MCENSAEPFDAAQGERINTRNYNPEPFVLSRVEAHFLRVCTHSVVVEKTTELQTLKFRLRQLMNSTLPLKTREKIDGTMRSCFNELTTNHNSSLSIR
jgi:hypothetical protein